jgi:hypothetical protein
MNSDVLRARQILAVNAVADLDRLRRMATGEPISGDPREIADGIEQAIRLLERVPEMVSE